MDRTVESKALEKPAETDGHRELFGNGRRRPGLAEWAGRRVSRFVDRVQRRIGSVALPHVDALKHQRRRNDVESQFFDLLDEIGVSGPRDSFVELGLPPQTVNELVFFIDDQRRTVRKQSGASRVNYRRLLLGVTPDPVRAAAQPIGG